MPRLGSSRTGEHRLGNNVGAFRTAETYANTVQTTSSQTSSVSRTAVSFIPSTFDFTTGRLGDQRLGSRPLGGGLIEGIATDVSHELTLARQIETYLNDLETDAARHLHLRPTAETYVDTIQTVAIDKVPNWRVGGLQLYEHVSDTREWDALTLTFRAEKTHLLNRIRPLDRYSGKLDILEKADGGFLAVDRQDGNNTYRIVPPADQEPPRLELDYLVDEYNEELVDQQGNIYRASIKFVPETPRETTSSLAETAATGEWEFQFETGTIATKRVHQEIKGQASEGVAGKQLRLVLEPDQVKVLEESASHLEGVRVREVPDGENVAEDNTATERNTVHIVSPNQDVLSTGDYRVTGWKTEFVNEDFYRVNLSVMSA